MNRARCDLPEMLSQKIQTVGRSDRTIIRRIGTLEEGYLDRGRPLGKARFLFEIGPDGANVGNCAEAGAPIAATLAGPAASIRIPRQVKEAGLDR